MVKIGEVHMVPLRELPALFWRVFTNPFIDLGVFCYGMSLLLWLWTLSKVSVSVAYPMLSIGYILSVFAGYLWFGEPLSFTKLAGVVVIMGGVYLVAVS
jgi:drug/metabolite transporter (DMT)-like permease